MTMEKVLIVGCDNCMIDDCVACYPCIKALNNKEGEFAGLPADAQLVGLVSCGGCPGTPTITARLNQAYKWISSTDVNDLPTQIFIGNCIQGCPNKDSIIQKVQDVSATTITHTLGTHHKTPAGKDSKWWSRKGGDLKTKNVLFKKP
jgi:predicted metal-binding protein